MKDLQMYIDGQFCESSNGQWIDVLNPSTEEVISRQPEGTIDDVNRALDAARAAQKAWAKTPAIERTGYLLNSQSALICDGKGSMRFCGKTKEQKKSD